MRSSPLTMFACLKAVCSSDLLGRSEMKRGMLERKKRKEREGGNEIPSFPLRFSTLHPFLPEIKCQVQKWKTK